MKTTKITFDEIAITGTRRWIDKNGKRRQETRKFYQTMNPFNTKNGRQKTSAEIMQEITDEMNIWLNEGTIKL